jgi:catechol 2,3-dioxygenase-like lactoylglutathione lyase family enzyme
VTDVNFGNHAAVRVPRTEKDRIRKFYRDVLGSTIIREGDQKDDIRLGGDFYIALMYENEGVLPESDFLNAVYLELKADDVDKMRQKIVAFGVKVLDVPDPHLYFQAPGGQVFRLVGADEDLSKYEGTEHGEQFVGTHFTTTDRSVGSTAGQPGGREHVLLGSQQRTG